MSVLLEALKKAAEEKQQKHLGSEIPLSAENTGTPVERETIKTEYSDDELTTPHVQGNETTGNISAFNIVDGQSSDDSKEKLLDLETTLALEEMPSSSVPSLIEETTKESLESSAHSSPAYSPVENDWSLDDIPGYQEAERDIHKTSKSAEAVLQTMQFQQEESPNYSKLVLFGLALMAVILGFGYYGLIYFQSQSQQMTQELQQYQRVEAPLLKQNLSDVAEKGKPISIDNSLPSPKKNVAVSSTKEANTVSETTSLLTADLASKPSVQKNAQISKSNEKTAVLSPKPQPRSVPSRQLKIVSSTQVSEEMLGYQAYQKKDFQQAKIHYLTALHNNPRSLTALFGLGATSAKRGEIHAALSFYRQVLDISPYNKEAETAIAILEASLAEPGKMDKRLRFMINQSPNNAKLQAALGHQYAKQNDWVKAQKQYFKAYQLESKNADYALNLAISLDQIGQYSLAKRYYQQALVYSQEEGAVTHTHKIKQRLLTLRQYLIEEGGK